MDTGVFRKWPIVLAISCLTVQAQARVWHVAEKTLPGIDPNDQVTTIGKGVARLEPGDTLVVHGGIYREQVAIDKSGTAQQPVTIRAAEGESVTLTGADRLTDWTLIPGSDRVYSTPWPYKFVAWNKTYTHPNDDYHLLIGRC